MTGVPEEMVKTKVGDLFIDLKQTCGNGAKILISLMYA